MGKWDEIKSKKILQALREVLTDDHAFSHADSVEVLRAALTDGFLTAEEIYDLIKVARIADTMPPRSKLMFAYLVLAASKAGGAGPFDLSGTRKEYAAKIICDFMRRIGSPKYPNLNRDEVGIDLLMRVANPGLINQMSTSLCGPAAFLYSLAADSPAAYAKFAIDLFEKGKAKIWRNEVEPSYDCRHYTPPPDMSPAEWLTAGSLRDSMNLIFDYDSVGADGGTTVVEVALWFERSGYVDIRKDDNLVMGRDSVDIDYLNGLYNKGYRVVLRLNSKMLSAKTQNETTYRGNHFVVMISPIERQNGNVKLNIFTWGNAKYQIPQGGSLSQGDFLGNLYGYVAARPF